MRDFRQNFRNLWQGSGGGAAVALAWIVPHPGDPAREETPLSGAFLLSVALHLTLFGLAVGKLSDRPTQPLGILVERYGVPGVGVPALSEVDLSYQFPSEIPLGVKHRVKKKNAPVSAATEASAGEGGGRLGNATVGASSGTMGVPNGVAVSFRERYLYELKTFLDQRKKYPAAARTLGQSGVVQIAFLIHRDGTISDVSIAGASPHERLNQAALGLVKNAVKFKPVPEEVGLDPWTLTVPVKYELN